MSLIASVAFAQTEFERAEMSPTKAKVKMEVNPSLGMDESVQRVTVDLEKIEIRLDGFTTLIEAELDAGKRAEMFLSRAVLRLQKAQALKSRSGAEEDGLSKSDTNKDEIVENLNQARDDGLAYIRSPIITRTGKAYALYLLGLVHVEKSMRPQAADYFEQSLKTWSEASYSSTIVFYLADYLESVDQATKAIETYRRYMSVMSESDRPMAQYKIAWAYISKRNLKQAESIFIDLVKTAKSTEVGQIAVKDLAFTAAETRSERSILQLAEQTFAETEVRLEFLSAAYSNLRRVRGGGNFPIVFSALLKLAGSPKRRLQLWLSELKSTRQEFASKTAFSSFESLKHELAALPKPIRVEYLQPVQAEVEVEVSHLIRSYIDTYTLRTKNVEGIGKVELVRQMQDLFRFFDTYYTQSPKRILMYQVWFDVCAAEAQFECLIEVANNVLKDKTLEQYSKRADVEKIIALNSLSRSYDKKYKDDLLISLEKYVANKENLRWAEFADLLANMYISDKQLDRALQVLAEVYRAAPSESTFYRLQLARFKAGKFEELSGAGVPEGFESSERLKELNREAALKLAIQSNGQKNGFAGYESNILRFLELNEDSEKEAVVLADYVRALIRNKQEVKAIETLTAASGSIRGDSKVVGLVDELMQFALKKARYDWIAGLVPESDQAASPRVQYLAVVAKLIHEKIFDRPRFSKLSTQQKGYLFQLLALVSPDQVIDYLVQFSEGETSDVRLVGALAFQVKENALFPRVTQSMQRALGEQLPNAWLKSPVTPSEQIALKIGRESFSGSDKMVAKKVLQQLSQIRKTRQLVSAELTKVDAETKVRILENLQTAELRGSEIVLQTPMPKGLSSAKQKAFVLSLEKSAKEFLAQANKYELQLRRERPLAEQQRAALNRAPASPSATLRVPLPRTQESLWLSKIAREQGVLASLVSLDVLRDTKKIKNADYFQIKVGIILRLPANVGRQSYSAAVLKREKLSVPTHKVPPVRRGKPNVG